MRVLLFLTLWGYSMAQFVPPSDPILTQVATEATLDSKETETIIDTMFRVAYGEQEGPKTRPILVGLAAPQIGISKRIILVDVGADGRGGVSDLREYINPEITRLSDEQEEWYEGCYSTSSVCGVVSRPKEIEVTAFRKNGEKVTETHSGYVARIFQHEIDHLNGHVFVDRIEDEDNLHWVEKDEMGEYRNQEKWRSWPNKCSREKWNEIKYAD